MCDWHYMMLTLRHQTCTHTPTSGSTGFGICGAKSNRKQEKHVNTAKWWHISMSSWYIELDEDRSYRGRSHSKPNVPCHAWFPHPLHLTPDIRPALFPFQTVLRHTVQVFPGTLLNTETLFTLSVFFSFALIYVLFCFSCLLCVFSICPVMPKKRL